MRETLCKATACKHVAMNVNQYNIDKKYQNDCSRLCVIVPANAECSFSRDAKSPTPYATSLICFARR